MSSRLDAAGKGSIFDRAVFFRTTSAFAAFAEQLTPNALASAQVHALRGVEGARVIALAGGSRSPL